MRNNVVLAGRVIALVSVLLNAYFVSVFLLKRGEVAEFPKAASIRIQMDSNILSWAMSPDRDTMSYYFSTYSIDPAVISLELPNRDNAVQEFEATLENAFRMNEGLAKKYKYLGFVDIDLRSVKLRKLLSENRGSTCVFILGAVYDDIMQFKL